MKISWFLGLALAGILGGGCAHPPQHVHSKEGLHHAFDKPEEWAARWNTPERDEWQKPEEVLALAGVKPGATVVDLGAGTGYFLPHLSKAVGAEGKVIALDVEPGMIEFLQKRIQTEGFANAEARQVPYDDPQLAPGSVDVILTTNTWHHIDHRDLYSAKLAAALKPGGRVVVVDYHKEAPQGPPPEHRLPASVVIEELGAGGLTATEAQESLPWQYIVIGEKK
jgi:predicted methyltransferase